MFILKIVKVLCFDTVLEVLILKGLTLFATLVGSAARNGLKPLLHKAGDGARLCYIKAKTPAVMLALQAKLAVLPDTIIRYG